MSKTENKRLDSLDVFRGITIAAMILVNNPGSWANLYPPLKHAVWHGWTPTDFIFPFFLFIVGSSITLAMGKIPLESEKKLAQQKIFIRSVKIFLIGILMAAFPFFQFSPEFGLSSHLEGLRIMGVLQRIAICYLLCSLLFIHGFENRFFIIFVGILLFYWFLMAVVPVPDTGVANYDSPTANLGAYLDRLILGKHLWKGANREWDPEGLLSTLPAIATALLGIRAAQIIKNKETEEKKMLQLFVEGCLLTVLGFVWDWFFPINKQIWTSSYVLFTGGLAFCMLAICYYFIDYRGLKKYMMPFKIFGMNAMFAFVFSGLMSKTSSLIKLDIEGKSISLGNYFYQILCEIFSPINASLAYAVAYVLIWYAIVWALYRKNWFWKI
ncbi:MAG: DUF1624 domain-containing protein [Bacteroidetes bacterium]|nr:MAG: DUF1624 domain-containing protein [Bacteroidota bacterium]